MSEEIESEIEEDEIPVETNPKWEAWRVEEEKYRAKNGDNVSWRELISYEFMRHDETWTDVECKTLTEEELDIIFDCGYGTSEGVAFTLWTKKRVYFPTVYDGAEGVDSVPRNPNNPTTQADITRHIGCQ